nr:MFS transporter [Ferrimonas futtsuensis]
MAGRNLFSTLVGINFLTTLGLGVTDAFFSLYLTDLGARGGFLALALTLYAGSKCLFSPMASWCLSRLGTRRSLLLCLWGQLLIALGFLALDHLYAIALLRILQGGLSALFRPLMLALVSDLAEPRRRGQTVARIDLAFYSALALGPLLGGALGDHFGCAGVYCLLALSASFSLGLAMTLSGEARRPETPRPSQWRLLGMVRLCRDPALQSLLIYIFTRTLGIAQVGLFWPMMLRDEIGLSLSQTGIVLAANSLMTLVLLQTGGWLSDRCCRYLMMVGCTAGTALGLLLMAVVQEYAQALLLGAWLGGLTALAQPACTSLLLQQGERFERGAALSVFHLVLNLGFIFGPLLGGSVLASCGLSAVFVATGLLTLTASLFLLVRFSSASPSGRGEHWAAGAEHRRQPGR